MFNWIIMQDTAWLTIWVKVKILTVPKKKIDAPEEIDLW